MIRKLDQGWVWLLCALNRWVLRCAQAHCRREKRRWFRRHLAAQRPELN
jgi:hypothetical protein